ncbi:hypothetical protein M409DRAFT_30957 [Zasmidium cellare ATCC 36951]|uniref:asparagine synthase (glutamine-hydrolyzing) n=1 Tax=Zasmidium cellare ATCC 36951 TaxID=1080233 RepID=A0A6A6BVJ5_ZASCE|nr:uncharacterized protein M409DRAFT_30957 [Zasmidium cellare ATCC 36951]KAF2158553.1 hypothetical protein M409DRAFT_30957 [Zasmidium cellare ATCC 36951]
MCGIAAVIGRGGAQSIHSMLQAIHARGPDDSATTFVGDQAALGIQRLSIVGVESGAQPFVRRSRLHFVCNGELYNYQTLHSAYSKMHSAPRSDVEAILDVYEQQGMASLPLLDGIFSFVLYDAVKGTFLAARDRFGVKPLYYIQDDDRWYFASEVKALMQTPGNVKDVRQVPAGGFVNPAGVGLYHCDIPRPMSAHQPAVLFALLEGAVQNQMQADSGIPIGVFLSGGLDSSVIAALAARSRPDIVAFTIGMEGSPDVIAAREVASYIGIHLVECCFNPMDVEEGIYEAVRITESYNTMIVAEGLMTMLLAKAARRHGIKVVLCGEGADELFAGYGLFRGLGCEEFQETRRAMLANIGNTECRRLDRATMSYSVEARVPFLDSRVVDWAMGLPKSSLHQEDQGETTDKFILREAFSDLLPPRIANRRKVSFDDGSGILAHLEQFRAPLNNALWTREKGWAVANVKDEVACYLFRVWRSIYGDAGGADVFQLFGEYPIMQSVLTEQRLTSGGTGEDAVNLALLDRFHVTRDTVPLTITA